MSTQNGQETTIEGPCRQDVVPTGITLPRPWDEYRMEAEFADMKMLRGVVDEALNDVVLFPQRYAELMWLIDSWFVEDHHSVRHYSVERAQERFKGIAAS